MLNKNVNTTGFFVIFTLNFDVLPFIIYSFIYQTNSIYARTR